MVTGGTLRMPRARRVGRWAWLPAYVGFTRAGRAGRPTGLYVRIGSRAAFVCSMPSTR